ncbi:MAG: dockerin type I domain-containing protein [Phycisphaerae bacterium]|nr:dockerin type I domain-containing protein [Phycisphaerae bacterium]
MIAAAGAGATGQAAQAAPQCAKPARLVRLHPPGWRAPTYLDPSDNANYLAIGSRADLGLFETGGSTTKTRRNSFAISEAAEMAAAYIVSGDPHALFWTPVPLGGVAAHTAVDIHTLAGSTMSGRDASVAKDLASDRVIVGLAGDSADSNTLAWKWTLTVVGGTLTAVAADIHPAAAYANGPSVAYAIDEGSPAYVVGIAPYPCTGFAGPTRGFRELEDASGSILLAPPTGALNSYAFAIDYHIGGAKAEVLPINGPCGSGTQTTGCEAPADEDSAAWSVASTSTSPPAVYSAFGGDPDVDTEIRGILADERAVGLAFTGAYPNCASTAVYWDSSSTAPLDLGALEGDDESRAEAIQAVEAEVCGAIVGVRRPAGPDRVAGLWCGSGSTWQTMEIDDVVRWDSDPHALSGGTPVGCDLPSDLDGPYGRWTIEELHDINSYGQMIGTMLVETRSSPQDPVVTVREAIAITSREDVNSDFRVNAVDTAIVLGAWGTSWHVADVNGDGDVDGSDLAIVSGVWTGTAPCRVYLCTCEENESFTSGGAMSLDAAMSAALATLGFSDADAFAAWAAEASYTEVLAACDGLAVLMQTLMENGGGSQ